MRAPVFSSFKASPSHLQATGTLSLNIYEKGIKRDIRNLTSPILLNFTLDSTNLLLDHWISQMESMSWPMGSIGCCFINQTLRDLSSEGCSLAQVTRTSVVCSCTHLTDFMSFLNTGAKVMIESNYNLWGVLRQLTFASLSHNLGFHLALGYWSSFLVFLALFSELDRRKLKNKFFSLVLDSSRSLSPRRADSSKQMLFKRVTPSLTPYQVKYKRARSIILPRRATLASDHCASQKPSLVSISTIRYNVEQGELKNVSEPSQRTDRHLQYSERKAPSAQQNGEQKEKDSPPTKCNNLSQVQARLWNILRKEKTCSQKFCSLFRHQLASNNLPYGLFVRTSPFKPRSLRLAVLYLGVLLEIAVCAFFFDLNEEPQSSSFLDKLIENFWVSLYSVLLTAPLLLLVGLSHSLPHKWRKKLQECQTLVQVKQTYEEVRRPLRRRAIIGWCVFFLLSSFLFLYLICFTQIASQSLLQEWLVSSLLSVLMDQIVFELTPAVGLSLLGLVVSSWRRCSALMCLMLGIEAYRLYRNLLQD